MRLKFKKLNVSSNFCPAEKKFMMRRTYGRAYFA
jgi:hypothetical protein